MIDLLRAGSLLLVAVVATGVVVTREPLAQAMVVSLLGLVLAVVFTLYAAPDVALSQIVVGTVALPLVILLSLARIRRETERRARQCRPGSEER